VTAALGLETTVVRAGPSDALALDLYLRARQHYHSFVLADVRAAITLLEEAIRHAPDNAALHAGLALALQREAASGAGDFVSMQRAARATADAVRLGPELGEAHLAHAQLLLNVGKPAEAARAARIAVRQAPSLAEAHELLGRLLLEAGRVPDAVRRLDVAERLDPALAHVHTERVRLAALEGDWARHDALIAKVRDGASRTGVRRLVLEVRFAAWRRDEPAMRAARDAFEGAVFETNSIVAVGIRNLLGAFLERRRPPGGVFPAVPEPQLARRLEQWSRQLDAEVAGYLGEPEEAARLALAAADAGLFDLLWLDRCPLLDEARGFPHFLEARAKIQRTADAIVDAIWG
jgi:serine/threonine-protein kinase